MEKKCAAKERDCKKYSDGNVIHFCIDRFAFDIFTCFEENNLRKEEKIVSAFFLLTFSFAIGTYGILTFPQQFHEELLIFVGHLERVEFEKMFLFD